MDIKSLQRLSVYSFFPSVVSFLFKLVSVSVYHIYITSSSASAMTLIQIYSDKWTSSFSMTHMFMLVTLLASHWLMHVTYLQQISGMWCQQALWNPSVWWCSAFGAHLTFYTTSTCLRLLVSREACVLGYICKERERQSFCNQQKELTSFFFLREAIVLPLYPYSHRISHALCPLVQICFRNLDITFHQFDVTWVFFGSLLIIS